MKDQEKFIEGSYSEGVGFGEEQNLDLRGEVVPDETLKEELTNSLKEDIHVDDSNIKVDVHYGEVTLSGTASNRAMMNAAIECAEKLDGVKKVINEIQIQVS